MKLASLWRWFDSHHSADRPVADPRRIDVFRLVPFITIHLACLALPLVGVSPLALGLAAGLYLVRMFGITAGYHRHFSHRAFAAPRWVSFGLALLGNSAGQRGPLWWAAHHRHHHRHSDDPGDLHSPRQHGFWWSHLGWFLADGAYRSRLELVPDLARRPELVWLDRFDGVVPAALAAACFALGWWLGGRGWDTSGMQLLVWFCVSTVLVAHVTFCVNSLAHLWGDRPYPTADDSRNNPLMAVLTLGEGWHNNHHHYQASARQGFRWWQIDLAWYALLLLARLGLVSRLHPLPPAGR
jgi:stearoyl-CoA desaturase (delta-9 desaturase)